MSTAAFTIKVFGAYLFALGIVLALVPNLLLSVFAFPSTDEVWIRVLGVVVINVGVYYWYAAVSEAVRSASATLHRSLSPLQGSRHGQYPGS